MTAESIVFATLSTAQAVTAKVGTRIYPDLVPEAKAVPYIGYERFSTEPYATIHGTILSDDVRIMVACWATTRIDAESIADAVADAMIAAGHLYEARGAELDEATGRLAATLTYNLLINK